MDAVSEFDDKLNALLSDPGKMAQIMQMAQSISGGEDSPSNGPSSAASPPPQQAASHAPPPAAGRICSPPWGAVWTRGSLCAACR